LSNIHFYSFLHFSLENYFIAVNLASVRVLFLLGQSTGKLHCFSGLSFAVVC
jgi:hypothetical protein